MRQVGADLSPHLAGSPLLPVSHLAILMTFENSVANAKIASLMPPVLPKPVVHPHLA